MTAKSDRGPFAITDRTFLPIGIVTIVLATACGGSWWLSAMYARLDQMGARLERIEAALKDGTNTGVAERDLRIWIMTLKDQNAGSLKIPEWIR